MSKHRHVISAYASTPGCDVCRCGARRPVGYGRGWEELDVPEPRLTPPMSEAQRRAVLAAIDIEDEERCEKLREYADERRDQKERNHDGR